MQRSRSSRPHAGHAEGLRARLLRRDRQQVRRAELLVGDGLAAAEHEHRRLAQVARALGARHDQRAAAVADDAAVEEMERLRDHPALEHVVRPSIGRRIFASGFRPAWRRIVTAISASCSGVVP